jgi:hypothetical protein
LRAVKGQESTQSVPFVFASFDPNLAERYGTDVIQKAGKTLGASRYVLSTAFDAKQFWTQIEDCIPTDTQKRDALGSPVKTYSLNQVA